MKIFTLKFGLFFLSCYICHLLQTEARLSSVLSSALIGFLGSFTPFGAIIYLGSFAGMCSPLYLTGPVSIFFMSLIGATLYLFTKSRFIGFGGKLGVIAFISSLLLISTKRLW